MLIVNLAGSLAVGLLVGWLALAGRADATEIRFAFGVGFLGAFTTMSALSLELMLMIERKAYLEALVWGGGTLIACVLATGVGLALARTVWVS